jgi:catechol 2,3-dioxygenase-like lactoylglutathione lyase family enzyme
MEGSGGMAYRFLLQVPEGLVETANVAVDQAGDAQVLVSRPSHGLGIDDPYFDLTVAAHTLRVIDTLFDWYESLPMPRPLVRIVLHGGQRHALEETGRANMVALIRRDQPWVERSIPQIGDHEPPTRTAGYSVGPGAPDQIEVVSRGGLLPAEVAVAAVVAEEAAAGPQISAINYVQIQVNNLQRAEEFYQEFYGMDLLGRVRRGPGGQLVPLPADYSWGRAMQTGELADTTFLANGPLTLAVQNVGLANLLDRGALEMVSIGVDARAFTALKGEVLMRSFTVLRTGVASFVFRDPFNVNWEIAVAGSVPLIPV